MAASAAYIAIAATVAGAGVSAYSAHEQGQAQQQALNYQAAVARNNQIISEQYAQAETQKGQLLEEQKRQETAQREGAIRAAVGASGLDVGSGSPGRLQEDTARLGEFDALMIRNNAARAAYGYRVQGLNYGSQAQLDEMGASSAANAGQLGMWSSIIGGASSVADKWNRFKEGGNRGPWAS